MQLDLFEKDELKLLHKEHETLKKTCDNVRKGLFARHNELAKMYLQLRQEMAEIKNFIGLTQRQAEIFEFFTEKIS